MLNMMVTGTIAYVPRETKNGFVSFLLKLNEADAKFVSHVTCFDKLETLEEYEKMYYDGKVISFAGRPGITKSTKGDRTYHNLSCTRE